MHVAKTKSLISYAVTAKLICVFVFAYAKNWFSHDAAHLAFNPNRPNGQIGDSTFFLGVSGVIFIFYLIFGEIHVSKLNSPEWDPAFCSDYICRCLIKWTQGCLIYEVKLSYEPLHEGI